MAEVNRDALKSALAEKGRSARDVSLAAGLGSTAVKDILSGKSRQPGAVTLSAIASELGVSVDTFVTGIEHSTTRPVALDPADIPLVGLPIRFEVAAGSWAHIEDWQTEALGFYPEAIHFKKYEGIPQWLERVVGDSYNQKVPEGALVHVVDAIALEYTARQGDTVVVVRSRAQGSFVERSLKQVVITPFGLELWPRSHNPKYDQPLRFDPEDGSDDVEVVIAGVVVKAYVDLNS